MITNLRTSAARSARPLAVGLALFVTAGSTAVAQTAPDANAPANAPVTTPANAPNSSMVDENTFDPQYNSVTTWNPTWDTGTYDHRHVLIGTVADSKPYRILLAPSDPTSHSTMVDLKDGTIIRPEGTSLVAGMHVAMFGYWSKGTFIANRVVLRG